MEGVLSCEPLQLDNHIWVKFETLQHASPLQGLTGLQILFRVLCWPCAQCEFHPRNTPTDLEDSQVLTAWFILDSSACLQAWRARE